jgi:excisionase family DNA binding protein
MTPEKVYTPEGAAAALMVSPKTIREWLRTGRLKGIKIGRLWRVRESDLVEFLKSPPPQGGAEE